MQSIELDAKSWKELKSHGPVHFAKRKSNRGGLTTLTEFAKSRQSCYRFGNLAIIHNEDNDTFLAVSSRGLVIDLDLRGSFDE